MLISIIVPCYNEAANLRDLVFALNRINCHGLPHEFILVDNGSVDATKSVLAELWLDKCFRVVTVPENKGYGYGIQQGIKAAEGDYIGWIHADLQCHPRELETFFHFLACDTTGDRYFLKGQRSGRHAIELLFTYGQSIFNSILFRKKMYDIGAIPVLAERSLFDDIDSFPNDFSFDTYTYYTAKKTGFHEIRFPVRLVDRKKGKSSWQNGLKSRIRLSKLIIHDSIKIRKGEKIL